MMWQRPNCRARTAAVGGIRSILYRLPRRELEIRRVCARDAGFRSVCTDYEEAASALRHWQQLAKEGDPKVDEYARLLGELEEEIVAQLNCSSGARKA